jgi:hypothetical protein
MAPPVREQFGKRRLPPLEPAAPVKRSGHVALLVMGTLAVGGGAYALAPKNNCDPNQAGHAAITSAANPGQLDTRCTSRSWFSGGGHGYYGGSSSRAGFYGGGSSSSAAGITSPGGAAGNVTRGGFGSFAHAISAHFSGGG